jgi:hypothetical protein
VVEEKKEEEVERGLGLCVCLTVYVCLLLCRWKMEGVEEKAREGPMTAGQDIIRGDELEREEWELATVRSVRTSSVSCESYTDFNMDFLHGFLTRISYSDFPYGFHKGYLT